MTEEALLEALQTLETLSPAQRHRYVLQLLQQLNLAQKFFPSPIKRFFYSLSYGFQWISIPANILYLIAYIPAITSGALLAASIIMSVVSLFIILITTQHHLKETKAADEEKFDECLYLQVRLAIRTQLREKELDKLLALQRRNIALTTPALKERVNKTMQTLGQNYDWEHALRENLPKPISKTKLFFVDGIILLNLCLLGVHYTALQVAMAWGAAGSLALLGGGVGLAIAVILSFTISIGFVYFKYKRNKELAHVDQAMSILRDRIRVEEDQIVKCQALREHLEENEDINRRLAELEHKMPPGDGAPATWHHSNKGPGFFTTEEQLADFRTSAPTSRDPVHQGGSSTGLGSDPAHQPLYRLPLTHHA